MRSAVARIDAPNAGKRAHRVAESVVKDLDPDFVRLGRVNRDLLDRDGLAGLPRDGGLARNDLQEMTQRISSLYGASLGKFDCSKEAMMQPAVADLLSPRTASRAESETTDLSLNVRHDRSVEFVRMGNEESRKQVVRNLVRRGAGKRGKPRSRPRERHAPFPPFAVPLSTLTASISICSRSVINPELSLPKAHSKAL